MPSASALSLAASSASLVWPAATLSEAWSTETDLTAEMVRSKYGTLTWPARHRACVRSSSTSEADAYG